ncbi:hypothetical protein ABN763_18130 [Spongiivirga sp. MCCC 1A20706]|uniref:hypothetical protein n=1 Tax=Spongiivirga sp. MCCC 1A20706 TaxID=3160963 RepID=UPI0039772F37
MKTILRLITLALICCNFSLGAQDLKLNVLTIKNLMKTGFNGENTLDFIYLDQDKYEIKEILTKVQLELLKGDAENFIDDELPEGDVYRFITQNTQVIWNCQSKGALINSNDLYQYQSKDRCEGIEIPGGDQFIPGGDQFIPGGDQFFPGDLFSEEEQIYFLKINFESKYAILPVIITLKIK